MIQKESYAVKTVYTQISGYYDYTENTGHVQTQRYTWSNFWLKRVINKYKRNALFSFWYSQTSTSLKTVSLYLSLGKP
jgi:hypothetical protein